MTSIATEERVARLPGPPRLAQLGGVILIVLAAAAIGLGSVAVPFLALAVIVGLVFAVVTSRDLAGGVALLTLLTFFERIPGTPETGITVVKLAGGLLALVWASRILRRRTDLPFLPRVHPALAYAVVAFAAWAGASMLWAEDMNASREAALRLAQGALLLFIVFSALRERRHILWLLWAFVLGAVFSALIGLGGATAAEQVGPGSETIRLAGGIGDPNELAAILVPAVVLATGLLAVTRAPLARLLLVASVGILVLALFWTQSRGGLVAMAMTALVAPVLAGRRRPRVLAVIFSIGALAVTYFALLAPPEQLARVTSFDAGGGTGRPDLWAISLEMFRDHPTVGLGAGNFVIVEPRYAVRDIDLRRVDLIVDTPKGAHNTYLHTLTELGTIGMLLLASVFAGCLLIGARAVRTLERAGETDLGLLGRSIMIACLGMLTAFAFISAAHREQLWLLLGVLATFTNLARRAAATTGDVQRPA